MYVQLCIMQKNYYFHFNSWLSFQQYAICYGDASSASRLQQILKKYLYKICGDEENNYIVEHLTNKTKTL